jgi:hypothetical protein
MKKIFILVPLLIIIVALLIFMLGRLSPVKPPTVSNFEECLKAGYPVMESYPRKCNADGQFFTEVLEEPPVIDYDNFQ